MLFYEKNGCVQALLHQLKYNGQQHIADFLGRWYAALLQEDPALPQVDWVFPVPLSRRKIRKRGYNQCSRFGKRLAVALGARYSEQILIRPNYGQTQTRLDRWARWESSRDAFALRKSEKIEGCRILLVDDVITTGATLEACCHTLNTAPKVEIYLASMAVVR
jgi:ComF family protein